MNAASITTSNAVRRAPLSCRKKWVRVFQASPGIDIYFRHRLSRRPDEGVWCLAWQSFHAIGEATEKEFEIDPYVRMCKTAKDNRTVINKSGLLQRVVVWGLEGKSRGPLPGGQDLRPRLQLLIIQVTDAGKSWSR